MTLNFEIFEDDHSKSLIEYYKKYFWRIILFFLAISVIIANLSTFKMKDEQMDWTKFFSILVISFLSLISIYFIRSFYNVQKSKKLILKNKTLLGKKTIFIEDNGFTYGLEKNKYNWEAVKKIDVLPNYVYLFLHDNSSLLINKRDLNNSDINNFIGNFEKKRTYVKKESSKNIYWLGLIGLIPNIGLISGVILTIQGIKRKDNKLKLIGLGSILFTPLFWFMLTKYTNESDFLNKPKIEFTNHYLNEVVKDLEYYKSKNGNYPDSLGELRNQNKFFNDTEIFGTEEIFKNAKPAKFYYQKLENDYILKSRGQDLKLNTDDDIYPEFKQPIN